MRILILFCITAGLLLGQENQVNQSNQNSTTVKEVSKEKYVSPMRIKGLDPEFTRHMFIDPELASKVNRSDQFWINDYLRFGLYLRPRFETRYNLNFNRDDKAYVDRAMQTSSLYFIIDPSPYVQAKITFQDARVWGGDSPAPVVDIRAQFFANTPNQINGTTGGVTLNTTGIREAFFVLKNAGGSLKATIGRQILAFGDQRLIGGANWTINGLSFDGARLGYEIGRFRFNAFVTRPFWTQSGVNGVISANDTRANASAPKNGSDSTFYGTYNSFNFFDEVLMDIYSIGFQKKWLPNSTNTTGTIVNPSLDDPGATTRSRQSDILITTGFRLTNRTSDNNLSKGKAWDWTVESAWQTGPTGARTTEKFFGQRIPDPSGERLFTERQKYTGQMYVIQTGYTFFNKMRLGLQYTYASGDKNRTDASASTFQTLANPRLGVIPYFNQIAGLSENISTKNLSSYSAIGSFTSDNWGTFHFAVFENNKAVLQDAWYSVNGTARTSTENSDNSPFKTPNGLGRRIYREYDITWMYGLNDNVSLWIGGGYLRAGNAITQFRDSPIKFNSITSSFEWNTDFFAGRNKAAPDAYFGFFQFNVVF